MMSGLWSRLSASGRRTAALVQKQMIQLLRDRRTLMLIMVMPMLELLLFAYAVDLTVDHIPTAVADLSRDVESQVLIDAMVNSGFFDIAEVVGSEGEILDAIADGAVKAGLLIPPGFASKVERGEAQVLILLDGSDSFTVQSGYSAAISVVQARAMEVMVEKVNRLGGRMLRMPVTTSTRVLYNPNLNDLVFIMPGLVAMLLQVLAVNMTAQSVVREYEIGTIEQLLVTPARPLEIIVGKLVPNVLVASLSLASILLTGIIWFGVPFRGDPWTFAGLSLLFIVSGLGLGLFVSTVAQTQKQAQQITATIMLLSQLLTGFIYPRAPMPPVVRAVGNLIPLTYFIRLVRGIMTKGVGVRFYWTDVISLVVYSGIVMGISALSFKKRLD